MNPVHIHLLLNHVPILGTIFGLLILAFGLLSKKLSLRNAGLVTLVLGTVIAIPVFLTGEATEDAVEHLPGITEASIEPHEEAAEIAFYSLIGLGILALGSLLLSVRKAETARNVAWLVLIGSLAVSAMMVYTGYSGGKIHHTEISSPQIQTGPDIQNHPEED